MKGNTIEINGVQFAIEEELDLEYYSPFIDLEEIVIQGETINPRGNYTMSFALKGTPELAIALQMPQLLQKRNRVSTFNNCVLRSNGILIEKGNVSITTITGNINNGKWQVECNFFNDGGGYTTVVGEKNVRDLTLCGDIYIVPSYGSILGLMTAMHAALPSYFYDENGPGGPFTPNTAINAKRGFDVWRWVYDNLTPDQLQCLSWYAKLINQGLEPADYLADDVAAFISAPALGYFVFPSYYGEWDGAETESLHCILNHFNNNFGNPFLGFKSTLLPIGEDWVSYIPLRNQLVPMFYYHQVLKHCFSEFGYELQGELLEDAQFLKLILPNTYSILKEEVLCVENLWGTNDTDQNMLYCQNEITISPKNHLPDMSVVDFLRDFMLKFNVYFKFDGKIVTITGNTLGKASKAYNDLHPEYISEPTKSNGVIVKYQFDTGDTSYTKQKNFTETIDTKIVESVDESILPDLDEGDKYLQNNLNSISKKNSSADNGYDLLVSNLVPYVTGKDKTFESELTPVEMAVLNYNQEKAVDVESFMNAYLPYFGHQPTYHDVKLYQLKWIAFHSTSGDYDEFEIINKGEWSLNEGDSEKKIAIYHGLQQTLQSAGFSYDYPYMAFHNYAPITGGDVKLGNWHLGWLGAEGLIAVHWRDWINVFSGWKVTFRLPLTWENIRNQDWSGSDIIRSSKYYINAIKFKLPALLRKVQAIVETYEL